MQHKQSAASEQLLCFNNQPLQIGTEETGGGWVIAWQPGEKKQEVMINENPTQAN